MTERRESGAAPAREQPPAAPAAVGGALRPVHFFTGATLAVAVAAGVVLRASPATELVLAVLTVGAAGACAFAVYRMLVPFAAEQLVESAAVSAGRERDALERDKALTLRSIKELEFDRAMGKIGEADFEEMRGRLRRRAMRLIQQLEGAASYRDLIERDLATLRAAAPAPAQFAAPRCARCSTVNEADARFCKMCGHALA